MIGGDGLRLPDPTDPSAAAYKDWLHVNIFDQPTGIAGLVNLSLHGPPADPRSRVVGTALFHHPDHGWVGNTEVGGYDGVTLGPASIATEGLAIAVDRDAGVVVVSARLPESRLSIDLSAAATSEAIAYNARIPLGTGWISWLVVPQLLGEGRMAIGDERVGLAESAVYYDHNWGRWHWGDDFGWEWGCFLVSGRGPAVVLSRVTDRAHEQLGQPTVHLTGVGRPRRFQHVAVQHGGRFVQPIRRLPGAMAALHQDRQSPQLPEKLNIEAAMGDDWVTVEFVSRSGSQIIAPDPARPGYTFIHELFGTAVIEGETDGTRFSEEAMGVIEYVN